MITIHAWDSAAKAVRTLDSAALRDQGDVLRSSSDVVWIDLQQPAPEEERLVFEVFFPIHTLSLEDVTRLRREPDAPPHLPKVEEFPDYLFLIVNPLTREFLQHIGKRDNRHGGTGRAFTQLSAVLTRNILITHHYEPMNCIDQLRSFLQRHGAQCDRGPISCATSFLTPRWTNTPRCSTTSTTVSTIWKTWCCRTHDKLYSSGCCG